MTLIISNGFKNIDATIQSSDAHLGDYSLKIKQNHQIIRDIIIIAAVFNSDSQWVRISTTYFSIAKIAAYRAHLLNFKTVNQVYFTLSCQGMTWKCPLTTGFINSQMVRLWLWCFQSCENGLHKHLEAKLLNEFVGPWRFDLIWDLRFDRLNK